jgi:hypothetical protein
MQCQSPARVFEYGSRCTLCNLVLLYLTLSISSAKREHQNTLIRIPLHGVISRLTDRQNGNKEIIRRDHLASSLKQIGGLQILAQACKMNFPYADLNIGLYEPGNTCIQLRVGFPSDTQTYMCSRFFRTMRHTHQTRKHDDPTSIHPRHVPFNKKPRLFVPGLSLSSGSGSSSAKQPAF